MSDSASQHSEAVADAAEDSAEPRDETTPGIQPPQRTRYRPSEAWALRWLGPARP